MSSYVALSFDSLSLHLKISFRGGLVMLLIWHSLVILQDLTVIYSSDFATEESNAQRARALARSGYDVLGVVPCFILNFLYFRSSL